MLIFFFILKHEIEAKFGGSFLDKVDRIFIYFFIEDHARKEEIILRTRLQFLIQSNSIREIPLLSGESVHIEPMVIWKWISIC